jgi:hypothetical protein
MRILPIVLCLLRIENDHHWAARSRQDQLSCLVIAVNSAKICSYPQPMQKATFARVATHFDLDELAGRCESAKL